MKSREELILESAVQIASTYQQEIGGKAPRLTDADFAPDATGDWVSEGNGYWRMRIVNEWGLYGLGGTAMVEKDALLPGHKLITTWHQRVVRESMEMATALVSELFKP